jgi:hypothetical protein
MAVDFLDSLTRELSLVFLFLNAKRHKSDTFLERRGNFSSIYFVMTEGERIPEPLRLKAETKFHPLAVLKRMEKLAQYPWE